MAMNVQQDGGDEDAPMSEINTTPLVDVMLVLLIIFLITIPVANEMQKHKLPQIANIETVSKPEFIILVITENGEYFEGNHQFSSPTVLKDYIKTRAVEKPQPEVHIRADRNVRFDAVGRAIFAIQQGGIVKVGFLTEPPPKA